MTEELLKQITNAEEQAVKIKNIAIDKATKLTADAEKQAVNTVFSATQVCKTYAETQIKNAREEAQQRYDATIKAEERQSREYCAKVLQNAEESVSEIVGRIIGGNC